MTIRNRLSLPLACGCLVAFAAGCAAAARTRAAEGLCGGLPPAYEPVAPREAPGPSREPSAAPPAVDTRFDFVRWAHLCELWDEGERVVDLGTPAAATYTRGNWRTGWGDDVVVPDQNAQNARNAQNASVTAAIARGFETSLYVPVDRPRDAIVGVRARAIANPEFDVAVNGRVIAVRSLPMWGFGVVEVRVPAARWRAGENQIAFHWGGQGPVPGRGGAPARGAAVVDWVRVRFADGGAGGSAERRSVRFGEIVGLGETGPALRIPAGVRLTCLVPLPLGARFAAGLSASAGARLEVGISREGEARRRVVDRAADAATAVDEALAPAAADEVAAIDLSATGPRDAVVELRAPRITAPARPRREVHTGCAKNVIVFLIDTLREDRIRAFHTSTRVRTPVLDALARESTIFTRAAAAENWTKPSVATLLSSVAPSTHNAKTEESVLPERVELLSGMLKARGFRTGSFIANGFISGDFGFQRGWDTYRNYVRNGLPSAAPTVFRDALDWVAGVPREQRFFLYVHTIEPHVPYTPGSAWVRAYDPEAYSGPVVPGTTEKLLDDFKLGRVILGERDRTRLTALYDGEVSRHDEQIGRFVDGLRASGRLDDTIFVVVSDHGEEFFEHGSVGHGHTLFEELLSVPMILRLPGFAPAGVAIPDDVGLIDVVPTVLEALGVPVPGEVQGRSLVPALRGEPPDGPAAAFSEFLDATFAVRFGRYKGIFTAGAFALYDLAAGGRGERENVATRAPIARRFAEGLLYAYLGSAQRALSTTAPSPRRPVFVRREHAIAPDTAAQLRALGYAGGGR